MDIRALQLFQHLANSLHYAKTAAAMHVSPSTLSRAIQRLEEQCGTLLFVRDNRSVQLTASGQKVLAFSQQVLADWQQLKTDIDQHNQVLRGEVSLYCSVTASLSHLPVIIDRFRHRYPHIDIKLSTGDPALSVPQVQNQDVDMAIAIHTPDFPRELTFVSLDHIPLVLIAPKDGSYRHAGDIDWRKHAMVMPESGPSKRIVHHWFAEQGIRPRVYASVGGNEAIVSMVALGCGLGIVPQVVLDYSVAGSKVQRLTLPDIESYHLGLCCLQKRAEEPLMQAFIHSAKDSATIFGQAV